MTGPRSLYDLSAPIEETEDERAERLQRDRSFSLANSGTWKSPMAEVPPLPPDPGVALLDRARKAPAPVGEFTKGLNTSLISMEQGLTTGLPVLLRGRELKGVDRQLADYDAIDAGETPPSVAEGTGTSRLYARAGPETRKRLRERAQAAQESARTGIAERTAAHARLEEEKAPWAPRVPAASRIESLADVPDYLKALAGSAVPSLALGLGAGAVLGRGAAALTAWPLGTGESMSEGIRRGDPDAMGPWALGAGALGSVAERFGLPARYFGPGGGKGVVGALTGEAGAETAQTALGQVAKAGAYGDPLLTRENLVELGDAAIGGTLTGTGVHGVYTAGSSDATLPPLKAPQDMRVPTPETPASPGETMFKRADPSPPGTHSALRKTFDEAPFEEGTSKQWAEFLRSRINKGGLKPAELEQAKIWSLLESAREIPLTKDAIIDHLDSKAVKLEVLDRSEQSTDTRWHYDPSRGPDEQQTTPGGGEPGTYEEFIITAPEMTKPREIPPYTDEDLQRWEVRRPAEGALDRLKIANRKYAVAETLLNDLDKRIRKLVDNGLDVPDDLNRDRSAAYDDYREAVRAQAAANEASIISVRDEAGTELYRIPTYGVDAKKSDATLIRETADRKHREAVEKSDTSYRHSHWPGVKNPIAHARYDQRLDPDGNAYFVLQEGQSDIHQDAQAKRLQEISRLVRDEGMDRAEAAKRVPRDFGYETEAKRQAREEAVAAYRAATDAWAAATDAWEVDPSKENDDRRRALYVAKQEAATRVNETGNTGGRQTGLLPDAPFKDWMPLVLKTALAKAVKKGLTRFAWTTGDAQNERNQLSTKIRELRYHVAPDGKYEIEAFPLDHDDRTPVTMTVHPAELTEAVGKDIAGRIQAQEGEVVTGASRTYRPGRAQDDTPQIVTEKRSLKGEGLEMKGDGKRQIYDVMVKNELERIGRKWGVKAKRVTLPAGPIGGRAGEDEDGNPGEGPRYEVRVVGPSFGRAKLDDVPGATYRIFDNDTAKTVERFKTREEAEKALKTKYTPSEEYHYIDIPPEMAATISGEGVPLYKRTGEEADGAGERLTHDLEAIYERTPEYEEQRQQVEKEALALLKKIAPGVDLTVADKLIAEIDGKREEVMGAYYTPALDGNLIDHMVAISMNSPDWQATLNHEIVHFLKRAGYISKDEWSVLQKKAEGKGLDKREQARMTDLRERGELNASEKKELAGLENKASWIQRFDVEKLYPGRQDIWAEEATAKAKEAFSRGELKPGTFIAKVFDRISQFFDQLGIRLDALGLVSPQQVFRRVDSGEVGARAPAKAETSETVQQRPGRSAPKTAAHRLSNIDILRGDEVKERAPGSRTKSQVGFELNERAKKLLAKLKIPAGDYGNPKLIEIMSDAIAAEIVAAHNASGSASGWYSSTLVEAMKIAATMHPELETDPAARVPFLLAMAIASQNMDVATNLKLAEKQYSAYKKTGKFPLIGQGTASKSMSGNFAKANALMAEYSPEKVERFLNTKFKVAELERAGWDIGGEKSDQEVYGSAIFGPKIGNGFYQNLTGNFDPLTMDMWFMRGMGRLSGDLMPGDPELAAKQRKRLLDALKTEKVVKDGRKIDWFALAPRAEQAEELGIDGFTPANVRANEDVLMEFAHRIVGWHTGDYIKNRADYDSGKLIKPDVVQAAKRLLEQGATNDQPGSGGRRVELRHIFRKAMEKARADIPGLTTADAQAIWWYPEKELYKRLGYRAKRAEPTDYAKEMAALAREKGVDDDAISGARDTGRGGDAGTAQGEGEGTRPAYGKSERQEFLTARVLREIEARRGPGGLVYERRFGDDTRAKPAVGGRAVTPVHQFSLPKTTSNALRAIGVTAPDIYELPSATAAPDFHKAILDAKAAHPRGEAVYAYSPEEYGKMRLFTTPNGKAGFALKGDDIVSVFNQDPELKGWALTALMLATQQGGRRLDAFDVGLPRAYSLAGFRAVSRIPWSDPDKPPGWDKKAFAQFNNGEPDVVFMKYDPAYGKLYEAGDGKKFTGPDAYDEAVKKQSEK